MDEDTKKQAPLNDKVVQTKNLGTKLEKRENNFEDFLLFSETSLGYAHFTKDDGDS